MDLLLQGPGRQNTRELEGVLERQTAAQDVAGKGSSQYWARGSRHEGARACPLLDTNVP